MRGVNRVMLLGNVGQDPVVRYLANGDAVCNLSVATSEHWKDKATGKKQERTEWHKIVVFGKLAEICGEYVKKGTMVYVEGSLRTRSWEKEGVKQYTTEIVAREVQIVSRGEKSEDKPETFHDDDIPF